MKKLWMGLALSAAFVAGGVAQAQAPSAAQKAAAEKAAKDKAAKAKEAEVLGKYQDKAVANYKRNKAARK